MPQWQKELHFISITPTLLSFLFLFLLLPLTPQDLQSSSIRSHVGKKKKKPGKVHKDFSVSEL